MFHIAREIGLEHNLYARFFFCRLVSGPLRREMYFMEELAQSIGNKKSPGELDRDAATAVAACIGVTESLNCQIHAQTVALLANDLWRVSKSVFHRV